MLEGVCTCIIVVHRRHSQRQPCLLRSVRTDRELAPTCIGSGLPNPCGHETPAPSPLVSLPSDLQLWGVLQFETLADQAPDGVPAEGLCLSDSGQRTAYSPQSPIPSRQQAPCTGQPVDGLLLGVPKTLRFTHFCCDSFFPMTCAKNASTWERATATANAGRSCRRGR